MSEEEKDVIADSSTAEVVNQQEETEVSAPSDQDLSQPSTVAEKTLADQVREEEIDDKGVSYRNRYEEMRRKYDQVVESIPNVIEQTIAQKLNNNNTQQPQQREYSIQELEEFAQQNPNYRPWVETEKAKLIAKQAADELEGRLSSKQKAQETERRKKDAYDKVTSEFPDLFVTDSYGRKVWDNQNPIVREIAIMMQDDRLKNDPEGIAWATELAYSRSLRSSQKSTAKTNAKLKTEVKKLEKKTMVEGGNKSTVSAKDEVREAINNLKTTGSKKATEDAVKAYFKKAGYIS